MAIKTATSTRGGKRAGAGRPRKVREHIAPLPQALVDAKAKKAAAARRRVINAYRIAKSSTAATPKTVQGLAKTFSVLAIETLAEIALAGDKDTARVAAANALIKIAQGPAGEADKADAERAETAPVDGWDTLLQ